MSEKIEIVSGNDSLHKSKKPIRITKTIENIDLVTKLEITNKVHRLTKQIDNLTKEKSDAEALLAKIEELLDA